MCIDTLKTALHFHLRLLFMSNSNDPYQRMKAGSEKLSPDYHEKASRSFPTETMKVKSLSNLGGDRSRRVSVSSVELELIPAAKVALSEDSAGNYADQQETPVPQGRDRAFVSDQPVTAVTGNSKKRPSPQVTVGAKEKADRRKSRTSASDKPTKPKGPWTAYNFFYKEEREKISPSDDVNNADLGTIIGKKWREIDGEARKRYYQLAEEDLERYRRESRQYNDELEKQREAHLSAIQEQSPDRAAFRGKVATINQHANNTVVSDGTTAATANPFFSLNQQSAWSNGLNFSNDLDRQLRSLSGGLNVSDLLSSNLMHPSAGSYGQGDDMRLLNQAVLREILQRQQRQALETQRVKSALLALAQQQTSPQGSQDYLGNALQAAYGGLNPLHIARGQYAASTSLLRGASGGPSIAQQQDMQLARITSPSALLQTSLTQSAERSLLAMRQGLSNGNASIARSADEQISANRRASLLFAANDEENGPNWLNAAFLPPRRFL